MKKLAILSLASLQLIFAVDRPSSSTIIKEIYVPKDIPKVQKPKIKIENLDKLKKPKKNKSKETIEVKGFDISGNDNVPKEEFQAIFDQYKNKRLTFDDLVKVSNDVTQIYRDKGYFIARAYLPLQKFENNIVQIKIVEGYYNKFLLDNTSYVKNSVLQAILDRKLDVKVIDRKSLERSILLINDLPGVYIDKINIKPGDKIGTSDFNIVTKATPRASGYMIFDNYGNRYTSKNRVNAGIDINSMSKLGDKLSFRGLIGSGKKVTHKNMTYSVPLHNNGLKADIAYSQTEYELGDRYTSLEATGKSSIVEIGLNYPIIKLRKEQLDIRGSYSYSKLEDNQQDQLISDKGIDVFKVSLSYIRNQTILDKNVRISANTVYSHGRLKFFDNTSRSNDKAGANTQGDFDKLSLGAGLFFVYDENYSASANLQMQHALGHKNLDGSEDFIIGGVNGVKAFPSGESSAENGVLFSAEVFRTLPYYEGIGHKASIFYDIGKTQMENKNNDLSFNSRTLQDIGLAYYMQYKNLSFNIKFAQVLGGNKVTSEPRYSNKVLFNLGLFF